jgi:hypothetical protein
MSPYYIFSDVHSLTFLQGGLLKIVMLLLRGVFGFMTANIRNNSYFNYFKNCDCQNPFAKHTCSANSRTFRSASSLLP